MSAPEVRKIPFDFHGAPFIWNPDHPGFSLLMNQITFFAIGFGEYLCRAMLKSRPGSFDSQMPWHNPVRQPLPDYYQAWLNHWEAGDDVTQICGIPV